MIITDIKQQVKRADRYSIYIDGKYSFSLSESELAKTGLKKEQEVSTSELVNLREAASLDKAYDRCLRYIGIRPRSQDEMAQYLKRKDYEESIIRKTLTRLNEEELINDETFAKQWVEWRISLGGKSKRVVQAELMQKRVDKETIKEVLAEVGEETELDNLRELIAKKRKLSRYQDEQKLIAFCARRGYAYGQIKRALEEV